MSFESMSQDMIGNPQEYGPVYVYERGELYLPGCNLRYHSSKRPRPVSPNFPRHHQVHSNGLFNVALLRSICIEYVAKNISIVESLVGFPDIVGMEIFKSVCQQGYLENYKSDRIKTILQLFTESYRDEVVSELNLTIFPRLLLEDCLDLVCTFVYLHKLDVSDQQLGDEHHLWKAVGEMKNLTHLFLKNNLLSNKGLQHMTMPCRMFKNGPIHLQSLSLACNPAITDDGVRYLRCFIALQDLDLSGTGIKTCGLDRLAQWCSLTRQVPVEHTMFSLSGSNGWAGEVIDRWVMTYKEADLANDPVTNSNTLMNVSSFYKRRKYTQHLARAIKEKFPRIPCPSSEPYIRLGVSAANELHSTDAGKQYKWPRFSMSNQACNKVNVMSGAINLCTSEKRYQVIEANRSRMNNSLSGDLMSQYATNYLGTQCIAKDSKVQINPFVKMQTNKDKLMVAEHDKKSSKLPLNCELTGSILDSEDINLLSSYESKKGESTEKSLWSAMHSSHW